MKILVAILSCHARPYQRLAIRETWINDLPADVDHRFFLGRPPLEPGESGVVYLDCDDTYPKLTRKTHAMIKWALAEGYDWLFKCDDDTYVRPEKLLSSNFYLGDYSGFTEGRWSKVPADPDHEVIFAFAQGGAGYWLSRRAMGIVAEHLLLDEYCEDVSVGKSLALHGITPVHDARYQPQIGLREIEHPQQNADFLTMHKCDRRVMQQFYRQDGKQQVLCAYA